MDQIGESFRAYVLGQDVEGCAIERLDGDHIRITADHAIGSVTFYDLGEDFPEIVELSIVDPETPDEPRFFLHFELDDEGRAEQLFSEMADTLTQHDEFDTIRVLLCCTAGLTTTMFANKLQEAARTLSLDYSFEAIPLEEAKARGGEYDVVLLAPQVSYQRAAVAEAYPDAQVVNIPPKIFAAYDAGAALKLVMHLMSDNTVFATSGEPSLRVVRELTNDKRIMVVSVIARPRNSWMGWRIYDRGEVVDQGNVTKPRHDPRDIEDLLATLPLSGWKVSELDAVGIAMPGVVNRGTVLDTDKAFAALRHSAAASETHYELGRTLAERYGTKVFVDNNANAAAVGCYVSQESYDTVVFHTQQTGRPVGGQGIVVDGHLAKGRRNFAGELGPLFTAVHGDGWSRGDTSLTELAWTSEGMRKLVAPLLAADISLVAPDAIYVAVDLLDDMDALRDEVLAYFDGFKGYQADYLPDFVHVTDYRERISLGELALCLQKLHDPRPHRKH